MHSLIDAHSDWCARDAISEAIRSHGVLGKVFKNPNEDVLYYKWCVLFHEINTPRNRRNWKQGQREAIKSRCKREYA
jgi:hypothetical protein